MELLKLLVHPWDDIALAIGFVIVIYFLWRFNQNKATSGALDNYEAVTKSQELRIDQLTRDMERMKEDNKGLLAQLNQLIGENKALKDLLTYQDATFRADFEKLVKAVECLKRDEEKKFADVDTASKKNKKRITILENA